MTVDAILCSPPYADTETVRNQPHDFSTTETHRQAHNAQGRQYGRADGQVGALKPGPCPEGDDMPDCEWLDWPMSICYSEGWKDLLPSHAFQHPAKMARGLLCKILDFGLERSWWKPGNLLGDCFGGIGTTGLMAAYRGIRCISVELEPRFVTIAQDVYDLHRRELSILGCPMPVIVQGDSRNFAALVGEAQAVLTSPPWGETARDTVDPALRVAIARKRGCSAADVRPGDPELENARQSDYGHTAGQVGALPPGDVAAVLTSPPYAECDNFRGESKVEFMREQDKRRGRDPDGAGRAGSVADYGHTPGQVGALKPGTVDSVLTSPPYADATGSPSLGSVNKDDWGHEGTDIVGRRGLSAEYGQTPGQVGALPAGQVEAVVTSPPYEGIEVADLPRGKAGGASGGIGTQYRAGNRPANARKKADGTLTDSYGTTEGQVGRESGETYWQAVAAIYGQCYLALRPGGVLVAVVKNYVKSGAIVPLTDQTCTLLGHLGFAVETRIRCWLTNEREQPGLFGDTHKDGTSRKSFFRRLHERKRPDLKIDFEEVIVARSVKSFRL